MKTSASVTLLLLTSLAGCATTSPIPLGNEVYLLSQTSAGGVFKSMPALKSEVIQRANAFAASNGKVAVPVASEERPAIPGRQMPSFEYQFRLVDRGDPSAAGSGLIPRADTVVQIQQPQTQPPSPGKDIYADLLKLDDLRKRGIITEAEFEAQKAALLSGR